MKPSKLAASLAVVLSAVPFASFAQEAEEASSPFTWSVSAVSDYVWRGVSQTDEDPTAQAGLTYSHDSGFYAGVWGSGVDLGPGDPSVEVDGFVGLTPGSTYASSDTPGELTDAPGEGYALVRAGVAMLSTRLLVALDQPIL